VCMCGIAEQDSRACGPLLCGHHGCSHCWLFGWHMKLSLREPSLSDYRHTPLLRYLQHALLWLYWLT
jgi:hypothetical protein